MERKEFEIMAPVGSYESLYAAIQGGADAIYFGIEGLNMRAKSSVNFTIGDLHEIVRICAEHGMKSYLTVNTVVYDGDMDAMRGIIDAAKEAGISQSTLSNLINRGNNPSVYTLEKIFLFLAVFVRFNQKRIVYMPFAVTFYALYSGIAHKSAARL